LESASKQFVLSLVIELPAEKWVSAWKWVLENGFIEFWLHLYFNVVPKSFNVFSKVLQTRSVCKNPHWKAWSLTLLCAPGALCRWISWCISGEVDLRLTWQVIHYWLPVAWHDVLPVSCYGSSLLTTSQIDHHGHGHGHSHSHGHGHDHGHGHCKLCLVPFGYQLRLGPEPLLKLQGLHPQSCYWSTGPSGLCWCSLHLTVTVTVTVTVTLFFGIQWWTFESQLCWWLFYYSTHMHIYIQRENVRETPRK
jgi:hypothetical protein